MPVVLQRASDGDAILCDESQVAVFAAQGYVRTNPSELSSQNQSHSVVQPVPSGLVRLVKGDLEMVADPSQVVVFEAQGWTPYGGSAVTTRLENQPSQEPQISQSIDPQAELRALLALLDPNPDDDWTADKLIKLATLKEITGREVTRAEVNEVWPGFNRDVLRAHQAQSQPQ